MVEGFDIKWDEVYQNGKQLNKYPFTDLVAFYYNNFKENTNKLNILEIGCGAGNNLEFLSEEKHNIYGIDASNIAIDHCKRKFAQKNLSADFVVGEFTNLPYENNFFDIIINRAAICHTDIINANIAMKECNRVIKKSGKIYSTFFTNLNTFKANKIDFGYYNSFEVGFKNTGALKFYNVFEIKELFEKNNFEIKNLYLSEKTDMIQIPTKIISEWIIHSMKK